MKHELIRVNKLALQYFRKKFKQSKKAQEYVASRITPKVSDRFLVGYAPRKGLIKHLNEHKVEEKTALKAGLIGLNIEGTGYEVFTDRIVFPIINNQTVLGFGGRTLTDHAVKYLNSKGNLLYNKSSVLYILDAAKYAIYKNGFAILVEGYFDVLSLFSVGICNVVAVCGTACTAQHASLLRRWTNSVYPCFDADDAGCKAAERAEKELRKFNIFGKNIVLPGGYDPDTYVKEFGKDRLMELIEN